MGARGIKEWEKQGDVGQRVSTSGYKISKFWGLDAQHVTVVNNTVLYTWKFLTHTQKNK